MDTLQTDDQPQARTYGWKDLFFAPVGCLLTLSPYLLLGAALVGGALFAFVYYTFNIELFGLGRPPYETMQIDSRWETVSIEDNSWRLSYESYTQSEFAGLVRFIGPIRESRVPFLTHDVLVTSGDFADHERVRTSVADHRFAWVSETSEYPEGRINLVHAVPQNEDIYRQLLQLDNETVVRITGFEILRIDAFNAKGRNTMWWEDHGCNTLLVTSIEVIESRE